MITYELFSYWLFIWFIFHYIGIIKASPIFFLIIAYIIVHLILIIHIIQKKFNLYVIIKKIISNIYLKTIPIFLLFKIPIIQEKDILFGFLLSYIYVIILLINNKNPIKIYLDLEKTESIHNYLYDNIYNYLNKLIN